MKKRVVAVVCLIMMTLSLCSCSAAPDLVQVAKTGWKTVGDRSIELDEIYVIRYTSRLQLVGEVLDTSMYAQIPERGIAVLYHAYSTHAGSPFMDSYACFWDDKGNLALSFDYEENYQLYEKHYAKFSRYNVAAGEKAVEYLSNCNYIAGMINDADGVPLRGRGETNVWYALSDEQVARIGK